MIYISIVIATVLIMLSWMTFVRYYNKYAYNNVTKKKGYISDWTALLVAVAASSEILNIIVIIYMIKLYKESTWLQ